MKSTVPGTGVPLGEISTSATYDIIGPAKGTATGASLFGFISIGGEKKFGSIATGKLGPKNPVVQNAIYNAIQSVPTADALIAPRWNTQVKNYIIYKESTVTLEGKAIRYNPSK